MAELAFKEQDSQDLLIESVSNPYVQSAGVFLIGQHRRGKPVKLEALGRPQEALVSLAEQIETLGAIHAMSTDLIEALRLYMVSLGAEFSTKASAKPVYLNLEVAEGLPGCRFENSLTEVTCIGAEGIQVQGVSGQNVRATISGTATTSNAADVDAMFAKVQGLRLWLRCEAPTKEDIDGLMTAMEVALAGAAQAVGGSMSAEDFKNLLETLEAEGALTPQMEELIASLIALQKAEELGLSKSEIGELIQNISTLIAEGQASGLIPAAFIEATAKALGELSSNDVMRDFLVENGLEDLVASNDNVLSAEDRIAELLEQLEAMQSMEGLDPTLAAELQDMVESLKEQLAQDNADPAAIFGKMSEKLMDIASREGVPQAVFDGIGEMLPEIAALKQEISEAGLAAPDLSNPEVMLAMLEEIAAKIEAGELDPKDVPPELMDVIESLGGVDALTQEQGREARLDAVAAAIDAPDGSALGAAIVASIEIMSDPAMIEQLPPALQESVASLPNVVSSTTVSLDALAVEASVPDSRIDESVTANAPEISSAQPVELSVVHNGLVDDSSGLDTSAPPHASAPAQPAPSDTIAVMAIGGATAFSGGGSNDGAPPTNATSLAGSSTEAAKTPDAKPDQANGAAKDTELKSGPDNDVVKPKENSSNNLNAPESKGPDSKPDVGGADGTCKDRPCICDDFDKASGTGGTKPSNLTREQIAEKVQTYKAELSQETYDRVIKNFPSEQDFIVAIETFKAEDPRSERKTLEQVVDAHENMLRIAKRDAEKVEEKIELNIPANEYVDDDYDYVQPEDDSLTKAFCDCGQDHSKNPHKQKFENKLQDTGFIFPSAP